MSFAQNSDLPKVSIITVTLNAEKYIERCINTVLSQSYPNIEHVILDGNSKDNTPAILKRYTNKIAFWKSELDNGVYNAMNKAVTYATGDWILFIGADDILFPGFSEMAYKLKDENTIYYGNHKWRNSFNGQKFDSYQLTKENVCHQSIFYPRAVFDKYQYNEKYRSRADHVLNMQCWGDNRFRKRYYPIVISDYSEGGFSAQNRDFLYYEDKPYLIRKHLGVICFLRYKYRCYKNKKRGIDIDNDLLY
ncbi:glycosyltransferase involved in cell wall biosynthesis [Arcticibacter tournemirensis]|uniref:Glycosyltransferase n=1 Tax=Arcticibacter tournemirensis TaxID=699437 RepID=A0A5M9HCI5_9SPHI|nr:glycosyltransferase family 2 protein [Arcticibacter tournemirensis]KAA8484632.1 glycosyltransferase [Arcticibacter tournemirensis]TQM47079.1 glycosyltransferase involved in cell wall biosynthesis [Arcticibacter tournemirensis]